MAGSHPVLVLGSPEGVTPRPMGRGAVLHVAAEGGQNTFHSVLSLQYGHLSGAVQMWFSNAGLSFQRNPGDVFMKFDATDLH
jgi:hypothetical protein